MSKKNKRKWREKEEIDIVTPDVPEEMKIPVTIVSEGFKWDNLKGDFNYVIGGNGIFLYRKTKHFDCVSQVDSIPHLLDIDPCIVVKNLDKIPYSILYQAIDFFTQVYRKYKTESVLLIYQNHQTKEYGLFCPKQEVDGADCKWEEGVTLPTNCSLAGTIHSHADMSAFFSGTDDTDDGAFDGVHLVVGELDKRVPEIACSYMAGGERQELELNDVAFNDNKFATMPEEWMAKVTKKKDEWEDKKESWYKPERFPLPGCTNAGNGYDPKYDYRNYDYNGRYMGGYDATSSYYD